MNRAGVVIVTYNSGAEIGRCLDSVLNTGAQVVVVDNASRDYTCEVVERRGATLIANPWNRGFASAVNQGVEALDREYILLLNPDAELVAGGPELVDACAAPGVAAAGGRLIGADGEVQSGFMVRSFPTAATLAFEVLGLNRLWPGNPVNRRYRCLREDTSAARPVDQPAGAFLMFRKSVWRRLGGLDEGFHPVWFEDVDFCRRVRDSGYEIRYAPGAVARHKGGHSVATLAKERRELCWYDSLLKYSWKHFRPPGRRAVCAATILGSMLRALAGIVLDRSAAPVAVCFRVVRLSGLYLARSR